MADESHANIMANPPVLKLPTERTIVPVVPAPACPTHCTGRHTVDGVIACKVCGGEKYKVVLHEWSHSPGHYFTLLESMNGASMIFDEQSLWCCKQPMVRRWR